MDSHAFVFVTGLHRSGTSLLHRCLRNHTAISGFHNTGVAEDEGQHLQTVLPRNIGGPGRFGRRAEAHMTETHPLATPETAQAIFTQWSPHWDLTKPYLVEKSPPTLLRTRLFQSLFPNASFVVIVRHPVAVALATFNALASAGWAQDITVDELIEHWLICHEIFEQDAPSLKRLTVVKYEEFVAQPQSTLDALHGFLDLPSQPVNEEVGSNVNARYLAQWNAMATHPRHRESIERAMRLEDRVRAFGYSLEDWEVATPLSELPETVLETERLLLRHFTFKDIDDLAAIMGDPETTRFHDGPQTHNQQWANIGYYLEIYAQQRPTFWAVMHKADNRFIGQCGLLLQTVDGNPEGEVAYTIASPYWNQGLGTEAARGIKNYAFDNFPFARLISLIDPENVASQRVAEKNGMRYVKDTEFEGLPFRIYSVDRSEQETTAWQGVVPSR